MYEQIWFVSCEKQKSKPLGEKKQKAFPSSASPAPSFIAQDATTAAAFEWTSQDPFINKHRLLDK